MDNKDNKRGFSGLTDLTSEISEIGKPIIPKQKSEAKPSAPKQPPQPQQETAPSEPERKTTGSPPPIEIVNSGESGGSSVGKWIFGIIGVIFVIGLINSEDQSNKKPSYSPPSSSQSYSNQQRSSSRNAESEVEIYREQIISQATKDAFELDDLSRPASVFKKVTPIVPDPKYTLEAQLLLTELGYNPGPVDGKYGKLTLDAVKAFQKDIVITNEGWIDSNLLDLLRKEKASYNLEINSTSQSLSQTSQSPMDNAPPTLSSKNNSNYFIPGETVYFSADGEKITKAEYEEIRAKRNAEIQAKKDKELQGKTSEAVEKLSDLDSMGRPIHDTQGRRYTYPY